MIELKTVLEIPLAYTGEDAKLNFLIEQASSWIEELLNRPGFTYKQRTEYYAGPGTQKLLLRSRPVYPWTTDSTKKITVNVDDSGYYGAPSGSFNATDTLLTYGDDYVCQIDSDDGLSKSGILVRIGDFWPRPIVRQRGYLSPYAAQSFGNVKIVYYGGHTVETLPAAFRMAANLLVARLRAVFPLGAETSSESYEERSISIVTGEKNKLLDLIKPIIWPYRNWRW